MFLNNKLKWYCKILLVHFSIQKEASQFQKPYFIPDPRCNYVKYFDTMKRNIV